MTPTKSAERFKWHCLACNAAAFDVIAGFLDHREQCRGKARTPRPRPTRKPQQKIRKEK